VFDKLDIYLTKRKTILPYVILQHYYDPVADISFFVLIKHTRAHR